MNASSSSFFSKDPWSPNYLHRPTSPAHPIPPHQAGSLTAALKAHCQDLRVKRLFEGRRAPHPDECCWLPMPRKTSVWTREVLLCDGAIPKIYAHSIVPLSRPYRTWSWLLSLGSRPLGEALFDHSDLQRTPIHYKKLTRRHPLVRPLAFLDLSFPVLARRSLFVLERTPLLVTEVFLDYPLPQSFLNLE